MKRLRTTSKMSLLETQCRPTKNMHGLPCPYSTQSVRFSAVSDQLEASSHILCAAADAFGTT